MRLPVVQPQHWHCDALQHLWLGYVGAAGCDGKLGLGQVRRWEVGVSVPSVMARRDRGHCTPSYASTGTTVLGQCRDGGTFPSPRQGNNCVQERGLNPSLWGGIHWSQILQLSEQRWMRVGGR